MCRQPLPSGAKPQLPLQLSLFVNRFIPCFHRVSPFIYSAFAAVTFFIERCSRHRHQMGSGNKRRFLACKECHSVSHIDGLTEAFQGIAGNQTGNLRLIIAGSGHILDKCGCFRAGGADHVDADTEGSQLQSQALCKLNDPTLGGIVCEALHAANHAQFTAGADNGAVAALFIRGRHILHTGNTPSG